MNSWLPVAWMVLALASCSLPSYSFIAGDTGFDRATEANSTDDADAAANCDGQLICSGRCVGANDAQKCGGCGIVCPGVTNGRPTCQAGACSIICSSGYVPSGSVCVLVAAPRPISPPSTAIVTSQRPIFQWIPASGTDGAVVDLCRDRACTSPMTIASTGTAPQAIPSAPLARGVWFWRLRGTSGGVAGTTPSPTWEFTVGARSAAVASFSGMTLDVNGDGYADSIVGAPGGPGAAGSVYVYLGGSAGLATALPPTIPAPDGGGFGWVIANAGDVNGDGFSDVIVSAPGAAANSGRVYLFFGGSSGLTRFTREYN